MQILIIIYYMDLSFTSYVNFSKLFDFTKLQFLPIKWEFNKIVKWSVMIDSDKMLKKMLFPLYHIHQIGKQIYIPPLLPSLKKFYVEEHREIWFLISVLKCILSCVYIQSPHLLFPSCHFCILSLFIKYLLSMNDVLDTENIPWWPRQMGFLLLGSSVQCRAVQWEPWQGKYKEVQKHMPRDPI